MRYGTLTINRVVVGVVVTLLVLSGVYFFAGDYIRNVFITQKVFYTTPDTPDSELFLGFLPREGEITSNEFDVREGEDIQATLIGRVLQEPVVNQETGEIGLLVEFVSKDSKILSNVILGRATNRISTLLASEGFINQEVISYSFKDVSSIVPIISKGDPIYITLILIKEAPEETLQDARCDEDCRYLIGRYVELHDSNSRLIRSIGIGGVFDETLTVGPVSELILYN